MSVHAMGLVVPSWLRITAGKLWRGHVELWRHVVHHRLAYALGLVAALLASQFLGVNFTQSVPERLVWLERGAMPTRGDLIVFRFRVPEGPGAALNGARFLKRVKGVPGDRITVMGREVYLNGELVGTAIETTAKGSKLHPISEGVVPQGHYFFGGSSRDSLDSRYREIGLVKSTQIIARAHPIF